MDWTQVVVWIIIQGPLIYFALWQLSKSCFPFFFQSVVSILLETFLFWNQRILSRFTVKHCWKSPRLCSYYPTYFSTWTFPARLVITTKKGGGRNKSLHIKISTIYISLNIIMTYASGNEKIIYEKIKMSLPLVLALQVYMEITFLF